MRSNSKRILSITLTVLMITASMIGMGLPDSSAHADGGKKAIYFLPSYMASQLYDKNTGALVWSSPEFLGSNIMSYYRTKDTSNLILGLDENGNSSLEIDREKDAENGAYSLKFAGKMDLAAYIMQRLNDYAASISTSQNKVDVKFFAYDWRRSVSDAAALLREDIKKNGYTNVSFVCHSAGGLLCAKFIDENNKESIVKVDKAITLGTPMFGTYSALIALETGEVDMFLNGINSFYQNGIVGMLGGISANVLAHRLFYPWVTATLRNTVLTYEMLPSREYLSQYPLSIVDTSTGFVVNSEVISSMERFCEILKRSDNALNPELINGKEGYSNFWDDELSGNIMDIYSTVDSYHIAGTGSSTSMYAQYSVNDDGSLAFYGTRKSADGDGLVPIISALGIYYDEDGNEKKPQYYNTFDGVQHLNLIFDANIADEAIRFLDWDGKSDFSPKSGIRELSSANSSNLSIKSILASDDDVSLNEEIEVRLTGDVNITVLDPFGEEIGSIIDGIPDELILEQGIRVEYIDSATDTLCIYFPDMDYQIKLLNRNDESVSIVSIIMNALLKNGMISRSASYDLTLNGYENFIIELSADYTTGDTAPGASKTTEQGSTTEIPATGTKMDYVRSLELDKTSLLMELDGSDVLNATVLPSDSTVNYRSSDESVAAVDQNGKLTANGLGSAIVTAYTNDGNILKNCYVTVLDALQLSLSPSSALKLASKLVRNITSNTTAKQLMGNFTSANVRLVNAHGSPFTFDSAFVGTGCKVQLFYKDNVLDELVTIITSDIDGNGVVNSRDIASVQKHIFEIAHIVDPNVMLAADFNGDGEISSRDLAAVQRAVVL